jgi:hypothetical protein
MTYTRELYQQDIGKIMYSSYYRALPGKQHGDGTISEYDFLQFKNRIAQKIYKHLGGGCTEYLQVLLYLNSLATTPYGFGGANVLKEKFGYDKDAETLKIAQNLGLSEVLISDLTTLPQEVHSAESGIVRVVEILTRNMLSFSLEKADEIASDVNAHSTPERMGCSDELFESSKAIPHDEALLAKISKQENDMKEAILLAQKQGVTGDLVSYLLGISDTVFISGNWNTMSRIITLLDSNDVPGNFWGYYDLRMEYLRFHKITEDECKNLFDFIPKDNIEKGHYFRKKSGTVEIISPKGTRYAFNAEYKIYNDRQHAFEILNLIIYDLNEKINQKVALYIKNLKAPPIMEDMQTLAKIIISRLDESDNATDSAELWLLGRTFDSIAKECFHRIIRKGGFSVMGDDGFEYLFTAEENMALGGSESHHTGSLTINCKEINLNRIVYSYGYYMR